MIISLSWMTPQGHPDWLWFYSSGRGTAGWHFEVRFLGLELAFRWYDDE